MSNKIVTMILWDKSKLQEVIDLGLKNHSFLVTRNGSLNVTFIPDDNRHSRYERGIRYGFFVTTNSSFLVLDDGTSFVCSYENRRLYERSMEAA